jgi:uncharacterized membrane protein
MTVLIIGLVLFLGIHLVPTLTTLRAGLVAGLGQNGYKIAFSLVSAAGLVLIVLGYARAPSEPRLFNPFIGAVHIAPLAMAISFVLLAAANMKTRIRLRLKHPMLLGVGIWALVHLLANGHAKATLLFGSFLAYVVLDLVSAIRRNAVKNFVPVPRQDVIAVVAGIVLAFLVMTFHRWIFGVKVVPWGV